MQTTVTTIIFDTIYVFQLIARMASLFAQLQGGVVLLLVNKLPRCVVVEQNQTLCRNSIKSGCFVRLLHSTYQLFNTTFSLVKLALPHEGLSLLVMAAMPTLWTKYRGYSNVSSQYFLNLESYIQESHSGKYQLISIRLKN